VFVHALAILRLKETVVNPIVADLKTERVFHSAPQPLAENRVPRVQSHYPAPIALLKLIAVKRVSQVVREVGEQIEIVIEPVERDFRLRLCPSPVPFGLQAIALRVASVCRIQRAEETNQRHGILRDLIA